MSARAIQGQRQQAQAPIDFSRSAVSRYLQLAALFRRRIESGEWATGSQIPTIDVLAAQCGVARATVRQALDQLEADQLIERFRAKGTFVRQPPRARLWCEVRTDWSGMLLAREGATIDVLDSAFVQELPGLLEGFGTPADRYRRLTRLHSRDGSPFLLATLFVEQRLSRRIPERAWSTKTALRLISDVPALRSPMPARR